MKSRFLTVSLILCIAGSALAADPCQDVALVELRTRSLSTMSDAEKEYFFTKEKLCSELQLRSLEAKEVKDPKTPNAAAKQKARPVQTVQQSSGVSIGGVGALLAGMAALILTLRIVTL